MTGSEKDVKYESEGTDLMLSVCVAVYGVEAYIEQCVRSLFGQTLRDGIEFVFVDDATPDRSIEILLKVLEEYPERKSQVRIIRHEQNSGIVAARKSAYAAVRGRYVIACDPDDWVDVDLYRSLCDKAVETGADCVFCDYITEFHDGSSKRRYLDDVNSVEEMLHSVLCGTARGVLWNKLIRRELIQNVGVSCPDFFSDHEDGYTVIQVIKQCTKIVSCHDSCYHYRMRADSICNRRPDIVKAHRTIATINAMTALLPGPEFAEDWNFRKRWQLLWMLRYNLLPASEYRALWPESKHGVMKDCRFHISKRLILAVSDFAYPLISLAVRLFKS